MRTAGIICEYNPFHMGHKHQIDTLHSMGYDCVVCVMSGNYTQRGELAIFDKYTRAKSAVLGGADLVLELPFPFSSFSAEGFANSGVHILASLGVNAICFGSECGDIEILENAVEALLSPDFPQIYSKFIKGGLGSAAAYFEAVKYISGRDVSLLSNDILGISYISAIKKSNYNMQIIPIVRKGAAYNSTSLKSGMLPSASAIRQAIKDSNIEFEKLLEDHIPQASLISLSCAVRSNLAPISVNNIGDSILSFFKLLTPNEIISRAISRSHGGETVADDGCGICDRLCNVARRSNKFEELLNDSYNSKYTDARINRVLLFSIIGVSDNISHSLPQYTMLLAANEKGREFLSHARKSTSFFIVTKPADAPDSIQKSFVEHSDELYASAIPNTPENDFFIKQHPYMHK